MAEIRPLPQTPSWRLAAALARLDRAQRAAEADAELGVAHGRLMWLFSDREPRTLRQVSEALGLEQSTVNRQVNAALAAGLLRRSREAGQPAHQFDATEEGLKLFSRDLEQHLGRLDRALAALPDEAREEFPGLLLVFADAYAEAIGPAAGQERES